jgi:hypothetical protein
VSLTGGHVHDATQAQVLTQEIEPAVLLAKSYDSDGCIEPLEVRSIKPVIPPRANRTAPWLGSNDERPNASKVN